jgi:dihydropyrimidine dehydrogenase (NAD+) subunit PreT
VRRVRSAPVLLASILAAVGLVLAWRGLSFYSLGVEDRVDHPDFQVLRPSGVLGNGLGYAAGLLVLLNLLYLARRRQLFTFGSMRGWLDAHVFTGLLAFELAIFHSAFQLRTPIAKLTAASMAIVVGTGVIGRFIHALVGVVQARQLAPAAQALDEKVDGLGGLVLAAADAYPPTQLPANASHLVCLMTLPRWRREASARREAVHLVAMNHAAVAGATGASADELGLLVGRAAQAAAAEVNAISRNALLRSWRSLHRLFAILMLLAVAVHAAVAWHYGYRWIFD